MPAAVAVGKGSDNGLADSLVADDRALEEAAALVADSAEVPKAPGAVPPTGKAALLPAAVAAISASASLAGGPAVIDKVLARGAKAAAARLHGGAATPMQPRALPKDARFAEVRAHAPAAQRAACLLLGHQESNKVPGLYVAVDCLGCDTECLHFMAAVMAAHIAACSWLAAGWQECVWLPLMHKQASTQVGLP